MRPRLLDLPVGVKIDEEDLQLFANRSIYIGNNGYAYFSTNAGGPQTVHGFIAGAHPGLHVDHINGEKLDNRRSNLRAVTPQINQVNRKRLNTNNRSGIRGVAKVPVSSINPWRAQITVNRKNLYLGLFPSMELAIKARKEAELRYYGEVCP